MQETYNSKYNMLAAFSYIIFFKVIFGCVFRLPPHYCAPILEGPILIAAIVPMLSKISAMHSEFGSDPNLRVQAPNWINECLSETA